METKLNPNQIGGDVGGGLVGGLYVEDLRNKGDNDWSKWIELFPGNPTVAKCNNNAEYIMELCAPFESPGGVILNIEGVVDLWYAPGDGFKSYNAETGTQETVMSVSTSIPGVPYTEQYASGRRLKIKCAVDGTTRTWYYDVDGVWTALTHDEDGTAVASSFTDSTIDTTSTAANMLLNNGYYDFPASVNFNFSAFKITNNGQSVFDGSKAVKGVDYQTYRKDNGNTVPAIIKLTHYL